MTVFLGMIAGFINGIFGTGAGMIVLPGLISLFNMDSKVARGTSLFILASISFVTSLFYINNITNYTTLWFIVAGGIFGGVIGSRLSKVISGKWIKIILGAMMIISGVRMVMR